MKRPQSKLLVSVVGPTAVGKTALVLELASHYQSEVISADSRQFYRELSIGTAKPDQEELELISHHFINSHSVEDDYPVALYERDVIKLSEVLFQTMNPLFLTGGSGLYLQSIWQGFDPDLPAQDKELRDRLENEFKEKGIEHLQNELAKLDPDAIKTIDINNPHRLIRSIEICSLSGKKLSDLRMGNYKKRPFHQLKIGLDMDREELYTRINSRVDQMMLTGLLDEVKSVQKFRHKNALQTVGYRELFQYFDGVFSLEKAVEEIKKNTRRYAKRQMTWFRRFDDIIWMKTSEKKAIIELIDDHLTN